VSLLIFAFGEIFPIQTAFRNWKAKALLIWIFYPSLFGQYCIQKKGESFFVLFCFFAIVFHSNLKQLKVSLGISVLETTSFQPWKKNDPITSAPLAPQFLFGKKWTWVHCENFNSASSEHEAFDCESSGHLCMSASSIFYCNKIICVWICQGECALRQELSCNFGLPGRFHFWIQLHTFNSRPFEIKV